MKVYFIFITAKIIWIEYEQKSLRNVFSYGCILYITIRKFDAQNLKIKSISVGDDKMSLKFPELVMSLPVDCLNFVFNFVFKKNT